MKKATRLETNTDKPKFYNVSQKRVNSYDPAGNFQFATEDQAKQFIEDQKKKYGPDFWQFEITPVSH